MKSQLSSIVERALTDVGAWCGVDTARDVSYIAGRVEHEGDRFLMERLPIFGKSLEKGLRQGYISDDMFSGFRRHAGVPRFLRVFLLNVFDSDGVLLPSPSTDCIFAIRQVTRMCEKIRVDYSQEIIDNAIDGYLESERIVRELDKVISSSGMDEELAFFRQVTMLLWGDVLSRTEMDLLRGDLIPRHGPGKTADRLLGNEKWLQHIWPERLEKWFPYQEFLIPNLRHWREADAHVTLLPPRAEASVRIVTVPKTVSKARLIAMEPTAMQYCQQALDRSIRKHIPHTIAGSFVSLDNQIPNQEMACHGSQTGELATLDLSAASDSLSNQLVIEMLRHFPQLSAAVQSCRSTRADVRGSTVRIAKFASMGSALCFPIETMVFVTLAVMGTVVDFGQSQKYTLSESQIHRLKGQVRSFGDDILVPSERAPMVMRWLEAFGFSVNEDKSFWTGKFRESCGKDYYDGIDISIVRVREQISTSPRSAGVISTVSLRNLMYYRGMWHTAKWLDTILEKGLKGHYPTVLGTSAILGRHSWVDYEVNRTKRGLQCPEVLGYVEKTSAPKSPLNGIWALMKVLCHEALPEDENDSMSQIFSFLDDVTLAPDHLAKSGRPSVVATKLTWASPF
jgi:hypothetical protein